MGRNGTCRSAPATTNSRSGPWDGEGFSRVNAMHPMKNGTPVKRRKLGVALATPFHPTRVNKVGDMSIMTPVTIPVHMATSPINACTHISGSYFQFACALRGKISHHYWLPFDAFMSRQWLYSTNHPSRRWYDMCTCWCLLWASEVHATRLESSNACAIAEPFPGMTAKDACFLL